MTAQFSETLLLDGEPTAMCTEPLNSYFKLKGIKSPFQYTCTALWRGYQGVWEIRNGRLYLLELEGADAFDNELKLGDIFPGYPERVFAHWYTGCVFRSNPPYIPIKTHQPFQLKPTADSDSG